MSGNRINPYCGLCDRRGECDALPTGLGPPRRPGCFWDGETRGVDPETGDWLRDPEELELEELLGSGERPCLPAGRRKESRR